LSCLPAASLWDRLAVAKHQPAVEVKGATYTALRVRQELGGEWVAQCVVDLWALRYRRAILARSVHHRFSSEV
jgi:hypothetical protein